MVSVFFGVILARGGAVTSGPISSGSATKIVQTAASRLGLGRNLEVQSSMLIHGTIYGTGPESYYNVALKLPGSRWISAQVSTSGRIEVFQVAPRESHSYSSNAMVAPKPETTRLAQKLVALMGARGPYKARNYTVGTAEPSAMVWFDCVLNGHTFFNLNPTYAYRVDFDRITGELNNFFSPPPLPPTNARIPKMQSEEAGKKLEHWGKTHYRTGGGATYLYGPSWHEIITLVPELGYYKFKSEPFARLVWQGALWTQMNAKFPKTESGKIRVFLDATTGELITPDDPGMG